jgi:site-specific DNA-methyltransferase (cytosine-N4-specific)
MSRALNRIATSLRQKIRMTERIGGRMVHLDIARCRVEKDIAAEWIKCRTRIVAELENLGMTEAEWCQKALGCSIQTMRRRVQLMKGWKRYPKRRREVADNGQYGLVYAAFLASPGSQAEFVTGESRNERSGASVHYAFTGSSEPQRCQLITGQAKIELSKLPTQSVNTIVCSPPYWPPKRADNRGRKTRTTEARDQRRGIPQGSPISPLSYGVDRGLGFEETLPEYVANLVEIFHEARRALRDDGTCWVVLDDAYMHRRTLYGYEQNYGRRSPLRLASQMGIGVPSEAEDRLFGNLLFVPERVAMAMQEDGWLCRAELIWCKGALGRKESVSNRPRRNFEKVLMFTKTARYAFDLDPVREPLSERFYSTPAGRQKPGLLRMDANRDRHVPNNPLGRNPGSVWHIAPTNYRGSHGATFPAELVRRLLLISCPDQGVVLDMFGGAGTTAMVALELGHDAISIDINPRYTEEARRRLASIGGGLTESEMLAAD